MELIEGNLFLSCNEMSIRGFHELVKFMLQFQSESRMIVIFLEGTTMKFTLQDSFVTTAMNYFHEGGTDTAGGNW